ncbi:MAG: WD40 repeat domain-containing protein [Micromonosporaceae bacterium]
MHRHIRRVFAAAGAALSALAVTVASASCAAPTAPQTSQAPQTSHPSAAPGTQLWVSRYNGPGNSPDEARFVAVSPDGAKVFVTGSSGRSSSTVAYSAATGTQLWVRHEGGSSVAVSPDGAKVFVTGTSRGATSGEDYATFAYNVSTGAQLWVSRYNGPANRDDGARSVAVSPNGGTVFVNGLSTGAGSAADFATVAYNAANGAQLWASRYNGPGSGPEMHFALGVQSLAVSPSGATVFVTGGSKGTGKAWDYATVAYNAATGARLWVTRYNGPSNGFDAAFSVAVSPAGATVFVTGTSEGTATSGDAATVAYNAATGAQLWVTRYNSPANQNDGANSMAVSPSGGKVFVTGVSEGATLGREDYATLAYNAATGAQLWVKPYNGPANSDDNAGSVAVSPDGAKVYVTGGSKGGGQSWDYATIAYNASTGAQLWVRRYNGPGNRDDNALSVAVSRGGTVFVTGNSEGTSGPDYATVAYSG